jgi:2-(1,2-epoxy-1,2-dihydrophenyl)acetyl-CoA isomerase
MARDLRPAGHPHAQHVIPLPIFPGERVNETIAVQSQAGVATVTLQRTDAYNAFDLAMMERFASTLVRLGADQAVRAVVVTGAGRAFCAGGDLRWATSFEGGAPAAFHTLAAAFHVAIGEIRRMPKPVIAAINGVAAGGGFSLALACDFRVMASSATLRQAYTSSGLCLDGGGTFTLPRLVGFARALEIVAFDPTLDASQALATGLAHRVVPDGESLASAQTLASDLAHRSVHAFGVCKALLTDSYDTSLETQLERERAALSRCAAHAEGTEGLAAFVAKRKPRFAPD